MRLNIRFTILAIVLLTLVAAQALTAQTRPRLVEEDQNHPRTTETSASPANTARTDRSRNHSFPLQTAQSAKVNEVLNHYLSPCAETDQTCRARRIQIETTATRLIELVSEDKAVTVPSRRHMQIAKFTTYHAANFSNPIRRAPLRRKGRTQH